MCANDRECMLVSEREYVCASSVLVCVCVRVHGCNFSFSLFPFNISQEDCALMDTSDR